MPLQFVEYTDHASLRTAVNSPHLSQRMARWLSFFAEYNFHVEYKPGKLNVIADALSRRPDYESTGAHTSEQVTSVITASSPVSPLRTMIREAYKHDRELSCLIKYFTSPSAKLLKELPKIYRCIFARYIFGSSCLTITFYGIVLKSTMLIASSFQTKRIFYYKSFSNIMILPRWDIVAVRKHIWQSVETSTGRNNTGLYEITYKPAKCANA